MLAQGIIGRVARDDRGGASVEFVLIAVPMIIIAFCVVQFMLLAQAMIVIKGAAHAAARSALVHSCPPMSVESAAGNLFGAVAGLFNGCADDPEKWETAARIAVLPISASNGQSEARQNGCDYPEALVAFLMRDAVRDGLDETVRAKACYAFEPDNLNVQVEWQTQLMGVQITEGPPPIRATVQFKVPLLVPTRMIFNSGSRGDDTFYWIGEATATLL